MDGPTITMTIQNATTQIPSLPLQESFNCRRGGASGSSSNWVGAAAL